MNSSKINWFFKNSPTLFCIPLLIIALLVITSFIFSVTTKTFMTIVLSGWAYAILFLTLDVFLSLNFGRTGDTLKYFFIFGKQPPSIAYRGRVYANGNFTPNLVGKVGLIFILGVLPLYAFWSV